MMKSEHDGMKLGSGAVQHVNAQILDTLSVKILQNLSHRMALEIMPVWSGGLIILFNTLKRT